MWMSSLNVWMVLIRRLGSYGHYQCPAHILRPFFSFVFQPINTPAGGVFQPITQRKE